DRAAGLASAKLVEVVSFWPGRDQYIDHSADALASRPFRPFRVADLRNVPHALYLAHDTLLALSGQCDVQLTFELVTPGSPPLAIAWRYWDGAVWRDFKSMRPACGEAAQLLDSTAGLSQSGHVLLQTDCAQAVPAVVNGIKAFWVRGHLLQPLPLDPSRVL